MKNRQIYERTIKLLSPIEKIFYIFSIFAPITIKSYG